MCRTRAEAITRPPRALTSPSKRRPPPTATARSGLFAVLYVSITLANKRLTGGWPYSMMEKLTTWPLTAKFLAVQVAVLQLFLLLAWVPAVFA